MNRKIAMGPGAASLILVVLMLVMTMLAVTTMAAANSDEKLSRRSADMLTEVYTLHDAAERSLAALDAALATGGALPEGMTQEGDQVTWIQEEGNRLLECAVRVEDGRLVWTLHRLSTVEDDVWN